VLYYEPHSPLVVVDERTPLGGVDEKTPLVGNDERTPLVVDDDNEPLEGEVALGGGNGPSSTLSFYNWLTSWRGILTSI